MLAEVRELPGVRFAVVLSVDGLVVTHTDSVDRDLADTVAAGCSGLVTLGRSLQTSADISGDFRQVMVEWGDGFLFARRAADGSCLAVVAQANINPALIGQGMATQVRKIGEHFAVQSRS
jgi:predicted regulator of Ras-like GTPase activity (Roadblock/LC7/MglB family)